MSCYVYKYVLRDSIIYIGITGNLQRRLSEHGKEGDNIPTDGWNEINNADIYYAKVANRAMAEMIESVLINRYKPKYNKAKKQTDWEGLHLPEPNFILYDSQLRKELEEYKIRLTNYKNIIEDQKEEIKKLQENEHSLSLKLHELEKKNSRVI